MKVNVVFRWLIALGLVLGLSGANLPSGQAAGEQSLAGEISGYVSSPGGYPLPGGTLVKLFEPGGETVRGLASPDLDDGQFMLPEVPNGLYIVKAVPPEASGYTQSEPKPVSIINAPVEVGELALTLPQIIGTVTAPDGLTPTAGEVFVRLGDGQLFQHIESPGGDFAVGGLPVGSYSLQAFPTSDEPYWRTERQPVSITDPVMTTTVTLTLAAAQVWGTIMDDQGNPIAWARVIAANRRGDYAADFSRASGFWALGGLPDGSYSLSALPPWRNDGLLPPAPVTVLLPGASNPYPLAFDSPPKVVTGTVTTNTGLPVEAAQIIARRMNQPGYAETQTAADGAYTLNLSRGLWALTVKPTPDTLPVDWVYAQPPQMIYFHPNNLPENHEQDFEVVLADAGVSGSVQMPDGSPPPFTVTVGLHSDEGVGRQVDIAADGTFSLTLPNGGYKVSIFSHDPSSLGPVVEPVNLPINGQVDLGALTLLVRDAAITGTVRAEGAGVEGMGLIAWRPGAPGSLKTFTGPGGLYVLSVCAGEWHIQPAPTTEQPYLYPGAGQEVTLVSAQVVADIDFELTPTDAAIHGVLVNEAGDPVLDADGWAKARAVSNPMVHNGAPIQSGTFTILVPAGDYHVAAILPPGSPYLSANERLVSAAAGETTTITMTVRSEEAILSGGLWDVRNSDVVEGVPGIVHAWSEGSWVGAPIETSNGTYRLEVASGLWHLNYRIDPDAGYAKLTGPRNIPVSAGQTVIVPLAVAAKDSVISGVVLDPSGATLPGAEVILKGISAPVFDLWLTTRSDENGVFTLEAPYGRYHLGAAYPNPAWINPLEVEVLAPKGGSSGGHTLQFRLPDATLSGALTITNTQSAGAVRVWAWSEGGGFTQEVFTTTLNGSGQAVGLFALDVISNTTWRVGAAYETPSEYWVGHAEVALGSGGAVQDIILEGPFPKPAPVVVTFDAADPQTISLADGTRITIPGGAMPVEGQVTLRVVPIATLPHQKHANVLRYGYAFLASGPDGQPIEDHFNQEVVITFTYDQAWLLPQHIYEPWLKPAYFSTTTNRWEFPESFVVDMEMNTVSMAIDHFTDFALTGSVGYSTFLPVITR